MGKIERPDSEEVKNILMLKNNSARIHGIPVLMLISGSDRFYHEIDELIMEIWDKK